MEQNVGNQNFNQNSIISNKKIIKTEIISHENRNDHNLSQNHNNSPHYRSGGGGVGRSDVDDVSPQETSYNPTAGKNMTNTSSPGGFGALSPSHSITMGRGGYYDQNSRNFENQKYNNYNNNGNNYNNDNNDNDNYLDQDLPLLPLPQQHLIKHDNSNDIF
jgi:hypothetical protein